MDQITNWMLKQYVAATSLLRREEGQGLVEYALIIAVVSVLIVASLAALRTGIAGVFTTIVAQL